MQFIRPDIDLDIIGKRKIAFLISGLLIAVSIFSLLLQGGPKYGIDFAGGSIVQIRFPSPVSAQQVKSILKDAGITGSTVQRFGDAADNEYLIRVEAGSKDETRAETAIQDAFSGDAGLAAEIRRVEMVGPQVGKDLREKALFAMFYALLFITIYISGRFEQQWGKSAGVAIALVGAVFLFSRLGAPIPMLIISALLISLGLFFAVRLRYALGAIIALIHDVLITVGVFSVFGREFSLPIIAALLTIIGYSLNDTIIVFDRIRENLRRRSKKSLALTINRSINETLSRTILTSVTTLIVVVCLFVLGGGIIHDFSFALLVGVLVGTYSSIYVASPILLAFEGFGAKRR